MADVDRSYVGDMCTKLCRNYTLDIWVSCQLDSGGVDGEGAEQATTPQEA